MPNLHDLVQDMNNSYMIPSPIMISGSGKPTDIRQVCETVQDFEDFYQTMGMDIRYPGLVTFEKVNNRFLGCKKDEDGNYLWVELEGIEGGELLPQLDNKVKELEEKITSIQLEYEDHQTLLFE